MKTETIQEKFDNNLYYSAISIPEWHIIKESLIVNKDNLTALYWALFYKKKIKITN